MTECPKQISSMNRQLACLLVSSMSALPAETHSEALITLALVLGPPFAASGVPVGSGGAPAWRGGWWEWRGSLGSASGNKGKKTRWYRTARASAARDPPAL